MRARRHLTALLIAVALVAAAGCSKVTRANYQKIENGMSYDEVVAILGEPDESSSTGVGPFSAATAIWKGRDVEISIQFVNDQVKIKSIGDVAPDDVAPDDGS